MPPPLPPPDEEDYDSAADSDFDTSLSPSSGDESEAGDAGTDVHQKGKKSGKDADGDVEMGSGDEGIVAQGRKKKKRRKGKGKEKEEEDEEEGPVGVRVRLRSGRGGDEVKKATLPKASGATIDIDSVWARLNTPKSHASPSERPDDSPDTENLPPSSEDPPSRDLPSILKAPTAEQTISIPHTYVFAGETHTSTKMVPTSSPEAQAYLATKDRRSAPATGPPLRRPLARKGLLDPNPSYLIRGRELPPRADLPTSIGGKGTRHFDTNKKATQWDIGKDVKAAKKLNTVEKSKLDWEAEVERQGMREELERAEKSGKSYMGRREFLERVEGKGEEEARLQRLKLAGVAG